jgi:hypothetical protein
MEYFQTGTSTIPCVVTQALMKVDAGLTASLRKVRTLACYIPYKGDIGIYQGQSNKAPTCFGFGVQSCITSRRLPNVSTNKSSEPNHHTLAISKAMPKESQMCASGQLGILTHDVHS